MITIITIKAYVKKFNKINYVKYYVLNQKVIMLNIIQMSIYEYNYYYNKL